LFDIGYGSGYILLIIGGTFLSFYVSKTGMRSPGRFLGAASLLLGGGGLVGTYFGIDGVLYHGIWSGFAYSLVTMVYLASRNWRTLILLALPSYLLGWTFFPSLPPITLFASLAIMVGTLNAYEFSEVDISALKKSENRNRTFRTLIAIYGALSRISRRNGSSNRSRFALLLVYSIPTTVILVIGILVWSLSMALPLAWQISAWTIGVGDFFFLAGTLFFSIVRIQVADGLAQST
jgi:hypothetical protein